MKQQKTFSPLTRTAPFALILIVSLSLLISSCIPSQPYSHAPPAEFLSQSEEEDRIETEDSERPRRRRSRRPSRRGGGNPTEPEPPEQDTPCPEENPGARHELASVTLEIQDYIHPKYRFNGGGNPRDLGQSSPANQNILLRLYSVRDEDLENWVALNKDEIQYNSEKDWFIYINNMRYPLELTRWPGEYTVDGVTHIVFNASNLRLYRFDRVTVHIAEETDGRCSYYQP